MGGGGDWPNVTALMTYCNIRSPADSPGAVSDNDYQGKFLASQGGDLAMVCTSFKISLVQHSQVDDIPVWES